jgi:UDP-N-acetylglucosamine 2-epimerase (non-hydrolysing)
MTEAPLRITVAVGTRPEVVKLAPVVTALRGAGHVVRVVATGQHADPRMYADMFTGLGLTPDVAWALHGEEGDRVGALLGNAFRELAESPPDVALVLGDTYTAPLVAIAARRRGVGVVHLEAGLRSYNELSTEESNRRVLAALATLHLAPTELAARALVAEGVAAERIRVVGNPVIDAVLASGVLPVPPRLRRGALFTAHRATNVDDPARLAELVDIVTYLGRAHAPVTFPVHPRTHARLIEHGLLAEVESAEGVDCLDPMPYRHLLQRLATSRLVVTDSGGLQEEASYFGVPVLVMRSTTPRWEGVETGAAVLTGLDSARVRAAAEVLTGPDQQARVAALPCPYGAGDTGRRVAEVLAEPHIRALLVPREPVLGDVALPAPA